MKFICRVEQDILFTLEINSLFPRNHVIFSIYVIYRIGGPYGDIFPKVSKTAELEGRGMLLRPREIFPHTERPRR